MSEPNGGPAFPTLREDHAEGLRWTEDGMTLRDWFAGRAMQGLLEAKDAVKLLNSAPDFPFERNLVDAAYGIADAMLEVRAKLREAGQ